MKSQSQIIFLLSLALFCYILFSFAGIDIETWDDFYNIISSITILGFIKFTLKACFWLIGLLIFYTPFAIFIDDHPFQNPAHRKIWNYFALSVWALAILGFIMILIL